MPEIKDITAGVDNCDILGGAAYAYATDVENVDFDDITVDASGAITDIGMLTSGTWGRLDFDDDENVSLFNEVSERVTGGALVYNGTGLMNFNGLSQYKINAAGLAGLCCGVVIIWVHYSGLRRVQGIDVHPETFVATRSKQKAKINPDINSNTGGETETLVYNTVHQGRYPSPTTTLSDAAIEAL